MSDFDRLPVSHRLGITGATTPIVSGHLNLGGRNPQGRTLAFNSYYMMENGNPCIPVMGEFHFSRYDARFWEAEMLKMKAGGINIVATYVFWNHIEEDETVFEWSGNKNLRLFIELCGKHQLYAFVRIGPFAHGECRNGGIPDWMYGREFPLRSNDPRYLVYVQRLYAEIARQLKGTLFKDGGPVIGIQLENEYMHCGAPWEVTFRQGMEWVPAGSEGSAHIAALKQLAIECGLDVPIYSCTGWRNSPILDGEVLPMQGGYAFTPWSPDPHYRQAPTREFLFRNRHLNPVLNAPATYDAARYPYVCCEIGGGIQDTYYHRPIVPPQSVEALAVMNLAGGSNLIGYYMYHGGSNPVGKHSYMNEYTVPRISYDFQAPIREFGQIGASFRHLRLLHTFLQSFGELLAPMQVTIPADASMIAPEDTTQLRYAVRAKDGAGFIFLNNYQDHVEMQSIEDIVFEIGLGDQLITLPHTESLVLEKDVTAILPFGLILGGVQLVYATTQLLTQIEDGKTTSYFFFAPQGMVSEYAFAIASYDSLSVKGGEVVKDGEYAYVTISAGLDTLIRLTTREGKTVQIFTLTRQQAEQSTVLPVGQQNRLLISEATLVDDAGQLTAYSAGQESVDILIYPPVGTHLLTEHGCFSHYKTSVPKRDVAFEQSQAAGNSVVLHFPDGLPDDEHNSLLHIDYIGDMGQVYINGRLVHDHFYNGTTWEIGLRQLAPKLAGGDLLIMIVPLEKQSGGQRYVPTGMAFRPEMESEQVADIHQVRIVTEYTIPIQL